MNQIESSESFRKIWEDIKKLSTTQKGILSMGNFITLFKKYSHIMTPILHVTEPKDLFEVLDEDNVAL